MTAVSFRKVVDVRTDGRRRYRGETIVANMKTFFAERLASASLAGCLLMLLS